MPGTTTPRGFADIGPTVGHTETRPRAVSRLRVVLAGPHAPALGGMATFVSDLTNSSLASCTDLETFNIGKTTPDGRSTWQGIRARLTLLGRWWRVAGTTPRPLMHVHTCSGLTYFHDSALIWVARLRGCRVVLHIHGARFDQFLTGLSLPMRKLAQWLARRAHRVVVLSPEWHRRLTDLLPGAQLTIVSNGVPSAVPEPLARAERDVVTCLFMGSLGRRKGVPELIDAMTQLPSRVHLELAGGDEDPGATAHFEAEIDKRGLAGRVRLLGPVRGVAKSDAWRRADVFVLPSHAEGVPIAMLEAMSVGLPLVVTSVGGIPGVIVDGHSGLLVPPGDVEGLREALSRLAVDSLLRRSLGEEGRRCWAERHSIEHTARALMAVYEEVACAK